MSLPKRIERALVIDDEEFNRDFISKLLQRAGLDVSCAENAEQALAALDSHALPDIAIIDYQLQIGRAHV